MNDDIHLQAKTFAKKFFDDPVAQNDMRAIPMTFFTALIQGLLAANENLIGLDRAIQRIQVIVLNHGFADFMAHEPRRTV